MRLRKLKKGLAILLTAAMVVGLVPGMGTLQVSAAESTEPQTTDEASVTINGETLHYATLEEAFSAASGKTATITMLNDAECSSTSGTAIQVESNITLNMNGKTLSGKGQETVGIINVGSVGSLLVQGPGTVKSTNIGLSCDSSSANMMVENITVDVSDASYGVRITSGTVTLNNVQITGHASEYAVYLNNPTNMTINNVSATETGYCDVYYYDSGTLKINGGTFDKISVKSGNSGGITSVSQLLGEGCTYRNTDKTWATADELNVLEIQDVTVEKIPLTINPQAESRYYNSAEHSLQMNAVPTTENNEITYEWYDGEMKLKCVSDAYTIPKTMSLGYYNYTCKATCDGYTLSHEFKFTVEECKHENFRIYFNINGFGNCPKCNEVVFQPADETKDTYDINKDGIRDNVYEIGNAGQLYWFAGLVNGTLDGVEQNVSANAILTANITVNENLLGSLQYDTEGNVSNGSNFTSWTPIGSMDTGGEYKGTFDGNNKTVSGLYFNDTSYSIGLFGMSDGNINNVGVVDSYFKGNDFVAGVCGSNINGGSITNCYNTGTVTATDSGAMVGGVCGENTGPITNCYNTGTVTATDSRAEVGGVCGHNNAFITNCYNVGTVTATDSSAMVGGVCGSNYTFITNCYYNSDAYNGDAIGFDSGIATAYDARKTTAQFASGEVAYLLSQGCTIEEVNYDGTIWGQVLGENGDTYPVMKKAGDEGNTVYTFTCGENTAYTNDSALSSTTQSHNFSAQTISDNAKISGATCTEKAKYYYSCTHCRAVEKNGEHVFEDGELAEHTDENLDGKCDVGGEDFKTFEQLGKLIIKVNQNLRDGTYAGVQYTTASIDNLRKALVAANAITAESSETAVTEAYDNLLAASTVDASGLIKADKNIVISFADSGSVRGIAAGNGWYANGDTVTLKVTPSVGYTFSKWTTDTAGNTSVGTESTYTFILAADRPDAYYAWLNEVKYTVTCGSVEGGTCSTDTADGKYVYGQTAKVTATANENYEFVGWKDSYGTTVSTDNIYSFTVIGNTTLTPEFVKVKTDEGADITYVTVSFYHQSGKLLDSRKVVSGEGQITTTVNAPTKAGFNFLGWSTKASGATAENVIEFSTTTFSEDTSLYPVFAAQNITYTLTVDLQTEQKAPQSSVTVTADPIEGKQFVGWKNADGNIVSYDSTYTFIITGDTTLTSYYEPINAVIEKTPTISMSAPVGSVREEGISKKATMYFNYEIPENYTLTDIGVIYISGEVEELDINTTGAVIRSAKSTIENTLNAAKNQFYYSKTVLSGQSYTFVGYITYTDAAGRRITVYSNLCSTNYQGL